MLAAASRATAVADAQGGLNLLLSNRDLKGELSVEVSARGFGSLRVAQANQLRHDDLSACNTAAAPQRVPPQPLQHASVDGERIRLTLAPASWNTVRLVPA